MPSCSSAGDDSVVAAEPDPEGGRVDAARTAGRLRLDPGPGHVAEGRPPRRRARRRRTPTSSSSPRARRRAHRRPRPATAASAVTTAMEALSTAWKVLAIPKSAAKRRGYGSVSGGARPARRGAAAASRRPPALRFVPGGTIASIASSTSSGELHVGRAELSLQLLEGARPDDRRGHRGMADDEGEREVDEAEPSLLGELRRAARPRRASAGSRGSRGRSGPGSASARWLVTSAPLRNLPESQPPASGLQGITPMP